MLAALLAACLGADASVGDNFQTETIVAVQVHGNTLTTDDEIRRLAGVAAGAPMAADTVDVVAGRLRAARRFERVQVLKRFASIADPSQVLLVIIVDEGAVRIERTGDPARPVRVARSRGWNLMFMPILGAEDGYGLTYGARFALPDKVGKESRIAFPLTWGGDKRAAVEIEKRYKGSDLWLGAAASRRENPHFEQDDDRLRLWLRAERQLVRSLRAGATAGWQRATFSPTGPSRTTDTFGHAGADITFDTRVDPVLPRNAIVARAAWERIGSADRVDLDARGYVGVFGQTVLAVRATRSDSSRPLAPYLKPLLGGMANLRGFRAGTAAGDTLTAASVEAIVPLTSPLNVGRMGVSAFVDAGTAYDKGARLADQTWKRGIGGSVWFSAAFLRLNVAVARGHGSSTRIHVGGNATF